MTKTTYQGSCECGRIKFEADIDLAASGTSKCNCTTCWKRRLWTARVPADSFRSLAGAEELSEFKAGAARGHRGFCKGCGARPYAWVDAADWNDGEYVSVNVACLDQLEPATLLAAPIQYCDGRADNWCNAPQETRHL